MHGPTCVFWTDLTPSSLKTKDHKPPPPPEGFEDLPGTPAVGYVRDRARPRGPLLSRLVEMTVSLVASPSRGRHAKRERPFLEN